MKVIKKYKTIITYLVSSLLSFAVDLLAFSIVLYFLKNKFSESILISSYIARSISSIFNYVVNKKLVFKNNVKKNFKAFIEYFVLVIINITISGTLVTKIYKYIHYNATIIKALVDGLIFIVNYFLQKYVIFKNKD
jgi:putative flippase GtrA